MTPIQALHAAILADPAIQQTLAEPFDPAEYVRIAQAYATAHGIAIDTADIEAPFGFRTRTEMRLSPVWPPRAWLPTRTLLDGDPAIEWCHFAGKNLDSPFFDEDALSAGNAPLNRALRYRTSLADFVSAPRDGAMAPSGLIFHMSRCGSTLVSQMFNAVPGFASVAEPSQLEAVVQLPATHPHIGDVDHLELFRAMAGALGRDRTGDARHYVIKTDAWHMLSLPLYRAAFPDVPWVFLYRDPLEVMVSHARLPGIHTAEGVLPPHIFGFEPSGPVADIAGYTARVLERICASAVAQHDQGGLLIHYRELPDAVFTRILPHFGITLDGQDRAAMMAASRRDAKGGGSFAPDGQAKRAEASDAIRAATDHFLAGVYTQLEAINASSLR